MGAIEIEIMIKKMISYIKHQVKSGLLKTEDR